MKVLVVGSGGREHALAWKLAQEAEVFAAPGNPGIAQIGECFPVDPMDIEGISGLAQKLGADFVLVGPENPLIAGLADGLRLRGIPVVGASQAAAQLEGSKAFAKAMMLKGGVPTAPFQSFTDPEAARHYAGVLFDDGAQVAVKASGAALGKGVVVCSTYEEAQDAIDMMMVAGELGDAGRLVVIEERLVGREFSLLTLVSGLSYFSLPPAQDYKRALDGDRGPNTGGMGTYSPVPWLSQELVDQTEREVVEPILHHLNSLGMPFHGVLFSGLMVQDGKPYCLEYNVRFGDPETQSVMMRLGSGFGAALAAVAGSQPVPDVEVLPDAAVTVVAASGGYPGDYEKGKPIRLPEALPENAQIFHAGTALSDDRLVTAGGRVLAVSARGSDVPAARALAYETLNQVQFEGMHFRRDIARH